MDGTQAEQRGEGAERRKEGAEWNGRGAGRRRRVGEMAGNKTHRKAGTRGQALGADCLDWV